MAETVTFLPNSRSTIDQDSGQRAVELLLEVADAMSAQDGMHAALEKLAQLALRATGADRCAILVRERGRLWPAAGSSRLGDLAQQWRKFRRMAPIEERSDPQLSALWRAPRTIVLPDAQRSEMIPESWKRDWGSRSLAFSPLRAHGEVYGLLAVDFALNQHHFADEESRLLDAIACAAGAALRSARLVERLQRSVEVERRLSECMAALRAGGSLSELLDLVADRFVSLLRGASCSINLLDPDRRSFRTVSYRGFEPAMELFRLEDLPQEDIAAIRDTWMLDPKQPVLVHDAATLERWRSFIPDRISAGMLVPLSDDSGVLGFVAVGRKRELFSTDDAQLAAAFADHASIAVAQARLNSALQSRLKLIEVLNKVSGEVAHSSDLRKVLHVLNRDVCTELRFRCTRVAFVDTSLATALGTKLASKQERQVVRRWRSEGGPCVLHLPGKLLVPIAVAGRVNGVLSVDCEGDPDPERIDFMKAIAAGIGEVAHKAKLRRTAERRAQELAVAQERERIARDLHDTVGQVFYGIGLKLQDVIADTMQDDDHDSIRARLTEVRSLAGRGMADVRSAAYALSFLHVRESGLVPSLRALSRQFTEASGIDVQLRVEGSVRRTSDQVRGALFRVAHEALVNIDRHARATGVVVTMKWTTEIVVLEIRDDGVGLDQRQAADWRSSAHFGMRAMARAIEDVGGSFAVTASHPRGLVIRATAPLTKRGRSRERQGSP